MATMSQECRRSRTILWCVPRTISTAITKCLSAIEDIEVWFEPYHCGELAELGWKRSQKSELPIDYKGNEREYQKAIDLAHEMGYHFKQEFVSYASIKRLLETASSSTPHVFVKDMGFSTSKPYTSLLPKSYKHTFLIRHPLRAIYSYRKYKFKSLIKLGALQGSSVEEKTFDVVRDNPLYSCFQEHQHSIWKYVRENIDNHPIVIDSDDFLANPAEMLSKYCRAVGLPYAESLLKWESSTDVVKGWKVPADNLFENLEILFDTAIRSCEFFPASDVPSRDHVTPDVIRYTDSVLKYYDEMYDSRIRLG